MTAPFEVSGSLGGDANAPLSTRQAQGLRAVLLAAKAVRAAQFAEHAATLARLTATLPADMISRDRAMAALHLYRAREAVEEIEDALARFEDGASGTRESCHRPIALADV